MHRCYLKFGHIFHRRGLLAPIQILLKTSKITISQIKGSDAKKSVHDSTNKLNCIPYTKRRRVQKIATTEIGKSEKRNKCIKIESIISGLREAHIIGSRITHGGEIGAAHKLGNHCKIAQGTCLVICQQHHKTRRKKGKPHGHHTTHSELVHHKKEILKFTHIMVIYNLKHFKCFHKCFSHHGSRYFPKKIELSMTLSPSA